MNMTRERASMFGVGVELVKHPNWDEPIVVADRCIYKRCNHRGFSADMSVYVKREGKCSLCVMCPPTGGKIIV